MQASELGFHNLRQVNVDWLQTVLNRKIEVYEGQPILDMDELYQVKQALYKQEQAARRANNAPKTPEERQVINEQRKAKKAALAAAAVTVFQEHGIEYQVQKNGSWYCLVEGMEYYYYPTTGRFRPAKCNTWYYSRGASDFLGKVYNYVETYC
jgi:hypothetical protein